MAGVIDENGVQWERCNGCGVFTRLTNLGYQPPSKAHPYGRDLCMACVNKLGHWHMARVKPSPEWVAKRG